MSNETSNSDNMQATDYIRAWFEASTEAERERDRAIHQAYWSLPSGEREAFAQGRAAYVTESTAGRDGSSAVVPEPAAQTTTPKQREQQRQFENQNQRQRLEEYRKNPALKPPKVA